MNSSKDIQTKPSDAFLKMYEPLLKGFEGEGKIATPERVRSKHGGLAILRELDSSPNCTLKLYGKADLEKFIPTNALQPPNTISRFQFALVSSTKTRNRFLIDLGSIMGTLLIDCEYDTWEKTLNKRANEMRDLLRSAERRCLNDTIHSDLFPAFKTDEAKREMYNIIQRSITNDLPFVRNGKLKLQSGLQQYDWYPLPLDRDQEFEIGDFVFKIDQNSEISAAARMANAPLKTSIIAADSPFAPPANDRAKQIRIFNAYLASFRDVKNNFALKDAIEEIEKAGGIEKMDGYPESFKCPVTLQPMSDPVIDINGHSVELRISSIITKSPKTNLAYPEGHQFNPNVELKDLMTQFYEIKGIDSKKLIEDQIKTFVSKK